MRARLWHLLAVAAGGALVLVVVEIAFLPHLVIEPTERGSLWVSTNPAVPAVISVDGTRQNKWGMWTDLPVGSHQVCFGPTANFTAPPCQTVTITGGNLTRVTGNYTSTGPGSLRVLTNPPEPTTIIVDGAPRNKWGLWIKLPTGPHTVCFGPVPGQPTPPCQNITVNPGAVTVVAGIYHRSRGPTMRELAS